MQVSVALTTYNGEGFLQEQLDSLATQTVLPCELVVGDDGSSDDTLSILTDFAERSPFPVHIHRNVSRLGYSDNFLSVAARCQGDLIAFCDQDDVWLPQKLGHCRAPFEDAQTMLISHNAWVTDQTLTKRETVQKDTGSALYPRLEKWANDLHLLGFTQVIRGTLLPYLLFQPRPRDPLSSSPMAHDQWSVFLASALGSIVIDGTPLALYRQHGQNVFGRLSSPAEEEPTARTIPDAETYHNVADLLSNWADVYDELAQTAHEKGHRPLFSEAAARYHRISGVYERRTELYQPDLGFLRRARRLFSVGWTGGYRPRRRGGLGAQSFAKDLIFVGRAAR